MPALITKSQTTRNSDNKPDSKFDLKSDPEKKKSKNISLSIVFY